MQNTNNLKTVRKSLKLSQQAVADKLGIVVRLYQYYESGEKIPNVYYAVKLAQILNSTVEELFPV